MSTLLVISIIRLTFNCGYLGFSLATRLLHLALTSGVLRQNLNPDCLYYLRMVRKPAAGIFVSKELAEHLENLGSAHKLNRWIADMKEALKENIYAGELVRKSQVPKQLIDKYGVQNLYRYGLPEGFRACYTIIGTSAYIIGVMSHSEYDKLFGYTTT